jgi:23S rRNA (pseudouridine1915-N3)-methyltransferase
MLDIILVVFGRLKTGAYQQMAEEYLRRLRPFAKIKVVELGAVSFSTKNKAQSMKQEADSLQAFLAKQSDRQVILLSESGVSMDSLTFSKKLAKINRPILLVIGGSLGFNSELKQQYPAWSLSPLTFPHELARVILLEQLYRATTIMRGKDYHY